MITQSSTINESPVSTEVALAAPAKKISNRVLVSPSIMGRSSSFRQSSSRRMNKLRLAVRTGGAGGDVGNGGWTTTGRPQISVILDWDRLVPTADANSLRLGRPWSRSVEQ